VDWRDLHEQILLVLEEAENDLRHHAEVAQQLCHWVAGYRTGLKGTAQPLEDRLQQVVRDIGHMAITVPHFSAIFAEATDKVSDILDEADGADPGAVGNDACVVR
jgi:hypothetical protein